MVVVAVEELPPKGFRGRLGIVNGMSAIEWSGRGSVNVRSGEVLN